MVTSEKSMQRYKLPMASEYTPSWIPVLKDAGFPTVVVVLDFETYFDSDYSMRGNDGLTTLEYIQDSRFEILELSHLTMNAEGPFADYESRTLSEVGEEAVAKHLRYLQVLYGDDLSGCTIVMQNAPFDASILAWRYGIYPRFIVDTLSLARAWNARTRNGLEFLCKQFGLPEKGDTMEFTGLSFRKRYMVPRGGRKKGAKLPIQRPRITPDQVKQLVGYANNDVMREWEAFTILLPKLSNPAIELKLQQLTLEMFTKPVLRLDKSRAIELIAGMKARADETVAKTGLTKEDISGNNSFSRNIEEALYQANDHPMHYMKTCKAGMMLALAKDDPERAKLAAHPSERVRDLIAARTAIKSWPLHIERLNRMIRMSDAVNGVFPNPLKYCGAHTGRDSGGEKINTQNFAKRGDPLIVAMRGVIVAPPGHKLVIVDSAAIEARGCAWVAEEWKLVDGFAQGRDVYCEFASICLGWPVRKARKTDIPAIAKRYKWARDAIGKIGILGCGYGMGPKDPTDKSKPNYLFAEAGLDLATAEKIVATYRETYAPIPSFWKCIERAFVYTAKYRKPCHLPQGTSFYSRPDVDVVMVLPNGRELKYHRVRLEAGRFGDRPSVWSDKEHSWEYLWGGTLTENLVQALSRDILMEAGLRMEAHGHHVVHRVHDELVLCVKEEDAPHVLELTIKEMSVTPVWAPRLPLGAEGGITDRYGKI